MGSEAARWRERRGETILLRLVCGGAREGGGRVSLTVSVWRRRCEGVEGGNSCKGKRSKSKRANSAKHTTCAQRTKGPQCFKCLSAKGPKCKRAAGQKSKRAEKAKEFRKDRKKERQKEGKTKRQEDRKTEREKDRKTERQTDRKTERQKDRKTE